MTPESEGRPESISGEHAESHSQLQGLIKDKLQTGAYDVLSNSHDDAIVITDSTGHTYEHRIDRDEAVRFEQALWTAGEDREIEFLVDRIINGLAQSGFDLKAGHFDVTITLRQAAA